MKKKTAAWLLAVLMAGCAGTSTAPAPSIRAELAPTGTLRVAVFTNNPVVGTTNQATGEPEGTTVFMGRALAESAGVPVRFVGYTTIAKLVEDATAGAWDVAAIGFDPARRDVLDFAPPHFVIDLTYLVPPGSAIDSVADADKAGVRIASTRNSVTTLLLQRTLRHATVVPVENEPAAFEMIKQGKAEAHAQNRVMLLGLAATLPGARVVRDRYAAVEIGMVLPKGRPGALAYVSAFVEQAKALGTVSRAIESAGLRGVSVAPAAR